MRWMLFPLNAAFLVISAVLLAVKLWALVDAAIRPEPAFRAADKQTKTFWIVVLVLAVVFSFSAFLSLMGLIAAIVYLVDVRPRLREIPRGRSTNMGPYGPW